MSGSGNFTTLLAAFALTGALAIPGQASTIIYSNIEPGDTFGPGVGIGLITFNNTFNYAGIGFTAAQSTTFESMELAVSLISGPNVLDVYLMGSLNGLPSGILESFALDNELSSDPATGLVTIDSVTHPTLSAGMQYWVVAAGGPTTFASWQQNVHDVTGPNVSGPTLSSLVRDSDANTVEALEVAGAAVPEPASWMLVFAALGLGMAYSYRKAATGTGTTGGH